MKWLILLWSKVSSSPTAMVVLKYAGIALAVLAVLFQQRQIGKRTAQIEALERRIKANEQGREIEREVERMPDGSALDELHEHWRRKRSS